LAAYFDRQLNKKVLIIDFDYQGSLSSIFLRASNQTLPGSLADLLISGDVDRNWLLTEPMSISALPNTKFVPASYSFASKEEQLMLQWLFYKTDRDVRFEVVESFLKLKHTPADFDIVIIDVGPRLTTAFIAALCACTHLIIPTNLDRLAAETIQSFLKRVKDLKSDFNLPIKLAGVVGTLMPSARLTGDENIALSTVREGLQGWDGDQYIFDAKIPRLNAITNSAGARIGYLQAGPAGASVRNKFNALGGELCTRIGL
jgi:cellulose biosynthesis protein BcsQ